MQAFACRFWCANTALRLHWDAGSGRSVPCKLNSEVWQLP